MPSFIHGKDSVVLYDQYNLSAYLNSIGANASVDVPETTAFGDEARTYIPGLKEGTISTEGMFDGSASAIDELFAAALGSASEQVVTVSFNSSEGAGARLIKAQKTSYEISSPFDGVVSVTAESQGDEGVDLGVNLSGLTTFTATGNGTAQDNGAATTNGGVGHLHVTANSHSSTADFKIQSSADNASWADLVTFTQVSAGTETSERVVVTGSVPRYLRAVRTLAGTGNITATIAFARR